jgi:hypothetical protein
MQMLDRKKGRIFGINVVDLLVVLIILFAVVSYISKPVDKPVYKGNQMYSAIQDHQRLDSRGFLVEGEIEGTFLWDNTPFKEVGILLPSTSGRLRLRKENGDIVVVGGERAYVEDVAASTIKITPIDNYLVVFYLDPLTFDSYGELLSHFESIKTEMDAEHLYLDVEIAVDSPMTPSERERIVNQLNAMYLARDKYLSRTETTGFVINIIKGEVGELGTLSIAQDKVTTNRIRAYAGYKEEPQREFPSEYHVVSATDLL